MVLVDHGDLRDVNALLEDRDDLHGVNDPHGVNVHLDEDALHDDPRDALHDVLDLDCLARARWTVEDGGLVEEQ